MLDLIDPKEIEIKGKRYVISKFPATAGREILMKYPASNVPKLGDYDESHAAMLKLMGYVEAVTEDGRQIRLVTEALINNHVLDWETLVQLEKEMIGYNCSFFQNGTALTFLETLMGEAGAKVTAMLTPLLDRLLPREQPPSTN